MIWDTLDNLRRYRGLHAGIVRGLEVLESYCDREPGRYELDGDRLYLMVQEYDTAAADTKAWEAHRSYLDIQYVCRGRERIGVTPPSSVKAEGAYDPAADVAFFRGEGPLLPCEAGTVVILYPGEIHMPGVRMEESAPVRKLVVKVLMD